MVPREYIPAVQKGVEEALTSGVLAGYPVVDVKVALTFGSYHDVDSSEQAFKMAAIFGFKEAARKANPVILEPMMAVEVIGNPRRLRWHGDRRSSSRRGMVQGIDEHGWWRQKPSRRKCPCPEMLVTPPSCAP